MTPNRSTTDRGFKTYDEFTCTYGNTCTIRQSSAALADRVWVFIEPGLVVPDARSLHLDRAGAERLIAALQTWIAEVDPQDDET